jgi:SPP1 family predicted phage head-tail adaptor
LIAAGELDRRIGILKRRVAKNEIGEEQEYFDQGLWTWAKVQQPSGRDYYDAAQVHAEETVHFTIRYRTDFNRYDRIWYQLAQFRIAHIAELGRREGFEIVGVMVATPIAPAQ